MSNAYVIPPDVTCLADYEEHARGRPSAAAWATSPAARPMVRRRAATADAYGSIQLKSRVLREMAGGSTRLALFGTHYDVPILLAPVAHHRLACVDAEVATVIGATAAGAGLVVSTEADTTIEEIAAAARGSFWFQLYIQHDRAFTHALVARAERVGAKAIVVTVDAPIAGIRNQEQRAGITSGSLGEAVNLRGLGPGPVAHAPLGRSLLFDGFLTSAARQDTRGCAPRRGCLCCSRASWRRRTPSGPSPKVPTASSFPIMAVACSTRRHPRSKPCPISRRAWPGAYLSWWMAAFVAAPMC